jgi:hypothetical protein
MGNTALLRFYTMQIDRSDRFREMSPFRFDTSSKSYIFPTLSIFDQPVGYGTINALSGDHSWNPLQLEKDLVTTNSDMLRVMALHQQHMMQFDLAAPDGKLARVDNNYILLAAKNFSHFYDYGRSLEYHLSPLDTAMIGQLTIPALVPGTFRELNATNAINMYVAVHSAAILLAEQAGAHPDIEKAKKLLYYAFLYNAYADHFLQDAFSAGHLLVNRSLFASITNNKALHDFYSNYGTSVVNARGNIWTAYGDKHFNQQHLQYEKNGALTDIHYPAFNPEAERIIQAIVYSISDIWEGFERGHHDPDHYRPLHRSIPGKGKDRVSYIVEHYKALQLIPIPYGTNLATIMPDSLANNPEIRRANQQPYLRNFVRSRIANSLTIGVTTNLFIPEGSFFQGLDIRLNVGLLASKYQINGKGSKKGAVDQWHGFTLSYANGQTVAQKTASHIGMLKGGIRSNIDYWISDKRFIGFMAYNEIGILKQNDDYRFVFVPQIGIQLGSLFNINYYNMPIGLRLPAQLILPLKYKFGTIISPGSGPSYFSGIELDLFF